MRFAYLFAAFAILASSTFCPAHAAYVDGNDLFRHCEAGENSRNYYQDQAYCLAYVVSAADYLEIQRSIDSKPRCIPAGVPPIQLVDIVRKFLKDNPDKRHWDAPALVINATIRAFCLPPVTQ